MAHFSHIDDLARRRSEKGKLYLEFLRVPAMSAGVYVLPAGATDPQKPHREDEMYYVVRGRARMQIGSENAEVCAGSVIFVEAGSRTPVLRHRGRTGSHGFLRPRRTGMMFSTWRRSKLRLYPVCVSTQPPSPVSSRPLP